MSYRALQPEQQKPDIPPRLQRKLDIYKNKGLEYLWQRDPKDKLELQFYQVEKFDKQREKSSLIRQINAINRVRDNDGNEWIAWYETRIVKDRTSQDVSFDDWYGVYPEPITRTEFDANGNVTNLYVSQTLPRFDMSWSIENLDKLLEASAIQVTQFAVTLAGADYKQPMVSDRRGQQIGNLEDFKNGTFDELSDMASRGFTFSKSPQLEAYRRMKAYTTAQQQQQQSTTKSKP